MTPRRALVTVAAIAGTGLAAGVAVAPMATVKGALGIGLFCGPGIVWSEALFGQSGKGLERAVAAACISLAVPVCGGVALGDAGIVLDALVWALLIGSVTLAGSLMLLIRKRARRVGRSATRQDFRPVHIVVFCLAIVIASAAIALAGEGSSAADSSQRFTELWLSTDRQPVGTALLGLRNDEGRTVDYRLVLHRNGRPNVQWSIRLTSGGVWQRPVTIKGASPATADLYRAPNVTVPYRHVSVGK